MIRDNVKQICKYQGRKLSEIADALNITRQSLHRFITGSPTLDTIQRIADALQVPTFILLHPKPLAALRAWNASQDQTGDQGQTASAVLSCPICGGRLQITPADNGHQDDGHQDQQHDSPEDKTPQDQDRQRTRGRRKKDKPTEGRTNNMELF